ncbi:excinuclease UvrABC ATPase subunit [Streptomyces ambofaciens]
MSEFISITGARENNLQDVTLRIPKGRLTVFTGVSGSGKSSVVFDTIAVESQRQLNETFPWFVRNRLPKYERPHADALEDLTPAIVVDQRPVGGHSRSTVGTMTDIHSVLRVLFSRHGTPSAGGATAYSFNDPSGMCPGCDGLGRTVQPDWDRILDPARSLADGAVRFPPFAAGTWQGQTYTNTEELDTGKPVGDFTQAERAFLMRGRPGSKVTVSGSGGTWSTDYEGLADRFERLYLKRDLSGMSERTRDLVRGFLVEARCPDCGGARLNAAALATRIDGRSIADCSRMQITDLIAVLKEIDDPVALPVAAAAVAALERVEAIGLGYLSLDRETATLSGGEGQRLKTVRHLGSSLTGMTYIFDEPSVGLHPRDVGRLGDLLLRLRDKGNTVLVVEHDPDVVALADHVVDMGPRAGADGGRVVFEGTPGELAASDTLTGRCLGRRTAVKESVRTATGELWVKGADRHNLREVTVAFATGVLTAVTGVAGSGKSTLVAELTAAHPDAVVVDQSAIGISARSTPATYLGIMDTVRKVFARETGAEPGLFSFNSAGGLRHLRGARDHPHRPRLHGPGDDHLPRLRGAPLPGGGAAADGRRPVRRRRARDDRRPGPRLLLRHRRAPQAARPARRRPHLPHPGAAAVHALRRGTAAHQAGHPAAPHRRRLHPGRADHRTAHVGRGGAARPAGPAGGHRQHGRGGRAQPGGGGARRPGDRPRPGRGAGRRPGDLRGHPARAAHGPRLQHRGASQEGYEGLTGVPSAQVPAA